MTKREGLPQEVLSLLSKSQSNTATSKLMRQLSKDSPATLDDIIIGAFNQFGYMPKSRKQVSTLLCRQRGAGLALKSYRRNEDGTKTDMGWLLTDKGVEQYL